MKDKQQDDNWNTRLNAVIPWGSCTCSKAPAYLPQEPSVIIRGKGCRVWDNHNREYIDFRNALGPITLGHAFPPVNNAIQKQLNDGIIFGHPHPLECEVAERLCDIIPCAEKVRFLKTGAEAVAASIFLARNYTGRDHVIQIGYNGWLNSLASQAMSLPNRHISNRKGIPKPISDLHHACLWPDLNQINEVFEKFDKQIAAVVVAMGYNNMKAGQSFYPEIRRLADKYGAVLIFDEIVTGFRLAIGGVQQYFGVSPDLAVFAKGIANGMPLSTFLGKKAIMDGLNTAIVSSTYGGETLSLAAAKATINTYLSHDVISHLWKMGHLFSSQANKTFVSYNLPIKMEEMAPLCIFRFNSDDWPNIQELFFRNAYNNGLSFYNCAYITYSHKENDIQQALERLNTTCCDLIKQKT